MTDEEQAAAEQKAAEDDALALLEFESAFSGTPLPDEVQKKIDAETATTETPETPEPVAESPETPETKTDDEPATEVKAEEIQPQAGALTPDDVQRVKDLLEKANSIDDIRAAVEKVRGDAFGRMGGLERELKKVLDAAQSAGEFAITEDDLAEVAKEYPVMTKDLVAGLNRAAKRMPKAAAVPAISQEEIDRRAAVIADQRIAAERERIRVEVALQILDTQHEGWREVVGAEGSETPFRRWLKTQPVDYGKKISTTKDPVEFGKALTKFKEAQKPKAPVVSKEPDRGKRLAEAVTPKGAKRPPAPKAPTAEDEFEAGFASGPGAQFAASR